MSTMIQCRLKQSKKHHGNGKRIMCANDGKIFSSLSCAAIAYGVSRSAISRQLKNERRTASGLCFFEVTGTESFEDLHAMRMQRLQECCCIANMEG